MGFFDKLFGGVRDLISGVGEAAVGGISDVGKTVGNLVTQAAPLLPIAAATAAGMPELGLPSLASANAASDAAMIDLAGSGASALPASLTAADIAAQTAPEGFSLLPAADTAAAAAAPALDPTFFSLDTVMPAAADVASAVSAPFGGSTALDWFDPGAMGQLSSVADTGTLNALSDVSAMEQLPMNAWSDVASAAPSGINPQTWKSALAALKSYGPTAALLANAYNQRRLGSAAQRQLQGIAAPARAQGEQLLSMATQGQINAADQSSIDQFIAQGRAQIMNKYAKMGMSGSSMERDEISQMMTQAQRMKDQAIANEQKMGLSALGISDPTLVAGVQAATQSDAALTQALQNYFYGAGKNTATTAAQHSGAPGG